MQQKKTRDLVLITHTVLSRNKLTLRLRFGRGSVAVRSRIHQLNIYPTVSKNVHWIHLTICLYQQHKTPMEYRSINTSVKYIYSAVSKKKSG